MLGLDYLFGAKYSDLILHSHPSGWAAGFFLNVDGVGDATHVIGSLAHTGKCPRIRVHGIWKDGHDFSLADLSLAVHRASQVQVLAAQYPHVQFEYSPFCEQNSLVTGDVEHVLDACLVAAPHCIMVNTVISGGGFSLKYKNEVHGTKAAPGATSGHQYNFSFDGSSAVDSDVEFVKKQHHSAEVFFFWDPLFNCRAETNDSTPRPQRDLLPDAKLIQSLVFLSTNRMDSFITLDSHTLYKSHGEVTESPPHSGHEDPRSNHPVIITPHVADHIEFRLGTGEVVGRANKYGPYIDGRTRYYADQWGFEIAQRAITKSGGPHTKLICGGTLDLGVVNPGFRWGH